MSTELLERLAAGPQPYKVVIRYEDGRVREIPCHSEKAAQNCAKGESRRIGRDLISDKGIVRIASVTVEKSA